MVFDTPLDAKVQAANDANAYAMELYDTLVGIFTPFVGQQIFKKDGPLLAKIKKLLPEFKRTNELHVYRHVSGYSLAWTVKVVHSTKSKDGYTNHAHYHETTVYVGNVNNGVLTEISKPPTFKTDYKVKDVEEARAKYREAEKAYHDAQSALYPFGEYDR